MTYEELVKQVKDIAEEADAGKIQEHVAFQFNIEGEAEGIFCLEVKDGKAVVEPYECYDKDVLIRCTADTLLEIMKGKLDLIFAFTIQKIKAEGYLSKALLLKEVISQKKTGTNSATNKPTQPAQAELIEEKSASENGQTVTEKTEQKGKFCRHCGAKVQLEDVYCAECGYEV